MRRILLAVSSAGALSLACHTITEDLPSRPSAVKVGQGIPTLVVQVPVPTPTPVPTPAATPTPQATPTPRPAPDPTAAPTEQNTNPVARVACSLYFVECDGQVVPGSHGASSVPVGCRAHLDATTKDANNEHTYRTGPTWVFSNPGMIDRSGNSPWNPTINAKGRHHQSIYAQADGVRCGAFDIDFE